MWYQNLINVALQCIIAVFGAFIIFGIWNNLDIGSSINFWQALGIVVIIRTITAEVKVNFKGE
jgi:hypothetical protein